MLYSGAEVERSTVRSQIQFRPGRPRVKVFFGEDNLVIGWRPFSARDPPSVCECDGTIAVKRFVP